VHFSIVGAAPVAGAAPFKEKVTKCQPFQSMAWPLGWNTCPVESVKRTRAKLPLPSP
jgi:hypothetical protein